MLGAPVVLGTRSGCGELVRSALSVEVTAQWPSLGCAHEASLEPGPRVQPTVHSYAHNGHQISPPTTGKILATNPSRGVPGRKEQKRRSQRADPDVDRSHEERDRPPGAEPEATPLRQWLNRR
jgi:hypothetical protein